MDNNRRTTTQPETDTPGATETKTASPAEQGMPSSSFIPELNRRERQEAARRTSLSVVVVHEAVREEGNRELQRPPMALAISGLAAGLSMGFSMVAEGLIHAYLPAAAWRPLLENFGYSLGFLIVVLGRQQLFTENTLTVILPLLAHPQRAVLWKVLRLWAIVLLANLVGAFIFAAIVAHSALFPAQIQQAFAAIARHSLRGDFGLTILRGIFAGWLIALMVWLLPASEGTRLHIIIILTYIVSLGGFAHIIAGSVDVLYLVNTGAVSWLTFLIGFMLPTLIGNIIGGVSLVAAINFAQVAAETTATG
jgi:formate/nitrite transporter FocA (FNT family)